MEEELIEAMRKIVSFYDNREASNKEISMWRNRFLASLPLERDAESGAKLWSVFLYMPTTAMIAKSPERHIKDIQEKLHENQ
jgi:hypothetical protein